MALVALEILVLIPRNGRVLRIRTRLGVVMATGADRGVRSAAIDRVHRSQGGVTLEARDAGVRTAVHLEAVFVAGVTRARKAGGVVAGPALRAELEHVVIDRSADGLLVVEPVAGGTVRRRPPP